MCLQVSARPN